MMTQPDNIQGLAEAAISAGDYQSAAKFATQLIETGEPWLLEGLSLRAFALENWNDGPEDRLLKAAEDWTAFIEVAPAHVSHLGLARVSIKSGDRDRGLENLLAAERIGETPEVILGFAHFYRTGDTPEIDKAKSYFLRAALLGRTQGMRGFAELSFEQGRWFSCGAMVLFGLLSMPILALTLGERRHAGF